MFLPFSLFYMERVSPLIPKQTVSYHIWLPWAMLDWTTELFGSVASRHVDIGVYHAFQPLEGTTVIILLPFMQTSEGLNAPPGFFSSVTGFIGPSLQHLGHVIQHNNLSAKQVPVCLMKSYKRFCFIAEWTVKHRVLPIPNLRIGLSKSNTIRQRFDFCQS